VTGLPYLYPGLLLWSVSQDPLQRRQQRPAVRRTAGVPAALGAHEEHPRTLEGAHCRDLAFRDGVGIPRGEVCDVVHVKPAQEAAAGSRSGDKDLVPCPHGGP